MAVTILSSPYAYAPVYNPIVFTVSSNNATQCSFRYIADVYVAGSYITRIKLFPDLNGQAVFKLHRILEDYVSTDNHNNLFGFATNPNSIKDYTVNFGEEYDSSVTCDSTTVIYSNLTNTSTFYAFNAALQYREWKNFAYTNYVAGATTSKFLTHMPGGNSQDVVMILPGAEQVLNFFHTSNNVAHLNINVHRTDGSGTTSYQIVNSQTATATAQRLLSVGVGPHNLNNATLSTGAQPVIDDFVDYYTIELFNGANGQVSEYRTFEIDTRDSRYDPMQLCWLNRLGGFDRYSYSLRNDKTVNMTKTDYNKLLGSYASSAWTYAIGDRGRTVLQSDARESYTAFSNWLTQKEADWMEELFTSPNVMLEDVCPFAGGCWTTSGSWAVTGGTYDNNYAVHVSYGGTLGDLTAPDILTPGVTYTLTLYLPNIDAGALTVKFGTTTVATWTTVGAKTVTAVADGTNLVIHASSSTAAFFLADGVNINTTLYADPIIITSTSFAELKKANTKNINYQVAFDKATDLQIQRG